MKVQLTEDKMSDYSSQIIQSGIRILLLREGFLAWGVVRDHYHKNMAQMTAEYLYADV